MILPFSFGFQAAFTPKEVVTKSAEAKKIEIPANERIHPVRPEEVRKKAPGNICCSKCSSDRIHISRGGAQNMRLWMRVLFVVYRCHTCGAILRHTRIAHWARKIFGGAKVASRKVIKREQVIESQADEFKQVKRDSNPVFREKVVEDKSLHLAIEPGFDIDLIVKAIKSNYTAKERELLASKFSEISVLIDPPPGVNMPKESTLENDQES